ncbi:MAG TPA: 3-deoxy-D-manno-octulosonic acid transferase [Pyrinomonadaceae bacterium]|nr:3-deoxy-D-manno-octulosonic acid transferase [Pyrinomonadaceae bacterium]
MYVIYSFLLTFGFVLLLPFFLLDLIRHGKYRAGLRQRLGQIDQLTGTESPIWLHCVSVGETQAARPLAKRLRQEYPNHPLVISTITSTGQRWASEVFKGVARQVIYFPFDWSFSVRRSLTQINPAVVLLMETEIWPNFLRVCEKRRIPVVIVNGRISERSCRRYRVAKPFMRQVLRTVDLAIMQSEEDAQRLLRLGVPKERIFASGNLKFDAGIGEIPSELTSQIASTFQLNKRPLIVAASTHSPEEKILIEAFARIHSTPAATKPRLLIAPRHPERFGEVAEMMKASGFTWTRRTSPTDQEADLMLLDTIGELAATYSLASIVFVGGSIVKAGGHNILEPAAVGACIVTGAHTFNFAAITREFLLHQAMVQLSPFTNSQAVEELALVFSKLLADSELRASLRRRAGDLVEQNLGATERTMKFLKPLFRYHKLAPAPGANLPREKAHTA